MRKVIGVYGNFEGLDADSSNKTKLPNRAKVCNNFWGHAGNLETRPGFTRVVPKTVVSTPSPYTQAKFLKIFTTITTNHGILIQYGNPTCIVHGLKIRHNYLRK